MGSLFVPGIGDQIFELPEGWRGIERSGLLLVVFPFQGAITLPKLVHGERRAAPEQPATGDEAGQRAGGEGAAAETEDENLVGLAVAIFIVVVLEIRHQPVVGLADVAFETDAESATVNLVEHPRAHPLVIEPALLPRVVDLPLMHQVVKVEDVGAVVLIVPGAVETDD